MEETIDIIEKKAAITEVIRSRRSVYADEFLDKEIPDAVIEELIINATWAPNYKCTEPWRFIVLRGKHRQKIGEFLLDYYRSNWDEQSFPPSRYEATRNYPQYATMIVLIMQRSTKVQIKEWEELAAVACAVQNLWLSCATYGLGGYWDSSDGAVLYGEKLGLKDNERCLGIFYLGYYKEEPNPKPRRRKLLRKKLTWSEE